MRRALATIVAAAAAATAVLAPSAPAPAAAAADQLRPVTYRPPVAAPVVDPFRPPATPFGPGNRGLEYGTRPGTRVEAAAAGTITFAGAVAGARYVTIGHADGLRTTYGPLATIAAAATPGATVEAGQPVGTTGARLLFTARLGADAYLDPAVLLAASGVPPTIRLVPDRGAPG
jgi:murein DD-endopeptidase MepM/ murein hydrolase activator NlpD